MTRGGLTGQSALTLRRPEAGDVFELARLWLDPVVMRFLGGVRPLEEAAARVAAVLSHWSEHGFGLNAVVVDGELAGLVGLERLRDASALELTYLLAARFHGRGLASVCAQETVGHHRARHGTSMTIVSISREANLASRAVWRRTGFVERHEFVAFGAPQVMAVHEDPGRLPLMPRRELLPSTSTCLPQPIARPEP